MFRWLSGPGEVFRKPLPSSTNYLNAYDRSGNLMRANNARVGKLKAREEKENENEDEDQEEGKEIAGNGEASGIKQVEKAKTDDTMPGLPKETAQDLMPFPMNRSFRSQAVLSEELKDAIWKRVMGEGKSVRDVSAALGVEMRRVAAVVRLKAVEKEWEKQVRKHIRMFAAGQCFCWF